jgi:antitoxin CcdA
MKEVVLESVEVGSELSCDRCGLRVGRDDPVFQEFTSIDHLCGYGSIFGDGSQLRLDLCQGCLKEVVGPWLRLFPSAASHT